MIDRQIPLEVCPTSNVQTRVVPSFGDHPLVRYQRLGAVVTISTDNRLMSNTTVTNELMLAVEHLGLDRHDLKSIVIYGFKRSFFPGDYLRKRQYVRQVIDYYEQVAQRHATA